MARHFHQPRWPGDTRTNVQRRLSNLAGHRDRGRDKQAAAASARLLRRVDPSTLASFDDLLNDHYSSSEVERMAYGNPLLDTIRAKR